MKQINDSRLVGMSIYNVAVLCMITAPVTLVIADKPNATFAFVALANVFCCFLSMALVFVPKVNGEESNYCKDFLCRFVSKKRVEGTDFQVRYNFLFRKWYGFFFVFCLSPGPPTNLTQMRRFHYDSSSGGKLNPL